MATRTAARSTFEHDVQAAAAGLAGLGVQRGATLAFWLTECPQRHVVEAAAERLGVAPLQIAPGCTVDEAAGVLAGAQARVLVCERAFLGRALRIRDTRRTSLEYIAVVDDDDAMEATSWEELLELGRSEAGKRRKGGHRRLPGVSKWHN